MTFDLTVQRDENTRDSWSVEAGTISYVRRLDKGCVVRLNDGTERTVLEAPEDMTLQATSQGGEMVEVR